MNPIPNLPPAHEAPAEPRNRVRFSIKSFLVLTTVFAATAASLAHLWRAANGNQAELGQFVIITAMLPTVMLLGASWFFKIFGKLIR